MYQGWLSFAGVELANVSRLVAYRDALLPSLNLRDCGDCPEFAAAMGDDEYTTPIGDEAEWVDIDRPETLDFLGFLPTSMSGFTDSTRTAGKTESIGPGGSIGRVRRTTREMRVTGWLIGASEAAAEAGFSWMKAALDGSACQDCEPGDNLCFLLFCPTEETELSPATRHIRRVTCTSGPTRISERALRGCGGFMIQIEFGLTSGSPYVFSDPVVVASAQGDVLDVHVDGALVFPMDTPLKPCLNTTPISGSGRVLRDPDCPPVPNPPTAPALSSNCKPLSFTNGYGYTASKTYYAVDTTPAYEARPHVANDGVSEVVVYSSSPTLGQHVSSEVHVRKKTIGTTTWGTETVAYNEGSGSRGCEPAGLRWVPSKSKFIMGVVDFQPGAALSPTRYIGRFLTSSDGITWTHISTMTSAITAKGYFTFLLTHVGHYDNGSADGVTYAVGHGRRYNGDVTSVFVLRSLNFGATWQFIGIPHPVIPTSSYSSPRIAIWPDGEIIIMATGTSTFTGMYYFRSKNGGSTWSWPSLVRSKTGGWPMPVIGDQDVLHVFYRDMTSPGPRGYGFSRYITSYDRGRTWTSPLKFPWYGTGGEMGQDGTMNPNGTIVVVMGLDASNTNANVYISTLNRYKKYLSYAMYVPSEVLKTWQEGVLNLQIRTGARETRQMRVTLLPRPLEGQLPEELDPCSNCGSFIIDYAPANTVVYIDGMTERVTMATGSGAPQPADHLVSGVNGGLFEWPILTCGTGYYVVIDVDVDTLTSVALGVVNRE